MNENRNRSKSPKDYQRKSPNNREPFLKSTSPTGNMATLGQRDKNSNTYIAPAKNSDDKFIKTSINR